MPLTPRSDKQIAASRLNGAKSRGPISRPGKAVSSQNSIHHGLTAASPLIKGESPEAFAALLEEFHRTYQPVGLPESLCVFHLATAHWKLLRALNFEADLINEEIDRHGSGLSSRFSPIRRGSRALSALESQPLSASTLRFHTNCFERTLARLRRELELLQAARRRSLPGSQATSTSTDEPETTPKINHLDISEPGLNPAQPAETN